MVNLFNTQLDFTKAEGPIRIKLTNDYLFHVLLQTNNVVLKALVASLLHRKLSQISSAVIQNPIIPGKSIDSKTCYMDVVVYLNDGTIINLEMQVINEHNWPERSLTYLSRAFDHLNQGTDYSQVHPVIHIGLLDFTLFDEHPEFYATYYMMNEKSYYKYSDKMRISVLDLTRRDLATQEDVSYELDLWASFFKAQTWKELIALAKKSNILQQAAATVYTISQDEFILRECAARESWLKGHLRIQQENEQYKNEIALVKAETEQCKAENAQFKAENAQFKVENAQFKVENAQFKAENAQFKVENAQFKAENAQFKAEIKSAQEENAYLRSLLSKQGIPITI